MKSEWVNLSEIESRKFVSEYSGPFSANLQVKNHPLDRFLKLSGLYGKVTLRGDFIDRVRPTPDINPDGSTSGKGNLRAKEAPSVEQKIQDLSVNTDREGYVITINGEDILEELAKKNRGSYRVADQFAAKFNSLFCVGLQAALFLDKFTTGRDIYALGKASASALILGVYYLNWENGTLYIPLLTHLMYTTGNLYRFGKNISLREEFSSPWDQIIANPYFCPHREMQDKSVLDSVGLPLELDRFLLASTYLVYQRIRGGLIKND